jgi:hypothetical protein
MSNDKDVIQIKISLKYSSPLIWRRLQVPATQPLRGLHRIIQASFSWNSSHLYVFNVDGIEYGDPELDNGEMGWENDQNRKLSQIAKVTDNFTYTYDFGDNWEHKIEIEEFLKSKKGVKYPLCIDGKETAPLDDVGSIPGHYNMLEALSNPDHPEHEEYCSWVGEFYHLQKFNISHVNELGLQRRRILNK